MKAWAINAAAWVPALIVCSLVVGAARGWCPATVHWAECTAGSLGYAALPFAAGYWLTRWRTRRGWAMALGGVVGVAVFYAFTSIGR